MTKFHRLEIAERQLETAVALFLSGLDLSSVITLAGAASGILDELVARAGKEPFVDYARRVHRDLIGHIPKRQAYAHRIEKRLGITDHKHLSKDDEPTIEIDLEAKSAEALARAIADFTTLKGKEEPFVQAFLQWLWENWDGPSMMKKFLSMPDRLKP